MGLDNGIVIKNFGKYYCQYEMGEIELLPHFITKEGFDDEFEICYWRNCHGLRDKIVELIDLKPDEYRKELNRGDVRDIIKLLTRYLDPTYFNEEEYSTAWYYEESIEDIGLCIGRLSWLEHFMKNHTEIKVEFYDSY